MLESTLIGVWGVKKKHATKDLDATKMQFNITEALLLDKKSRTEPSRFEIL